MKAISLSRTACLIAALVAARPAMQAASPTVAYVANNFSNSVSVIDTYTKAVIASIAVGSVPTELAITLNHKYVIVTNQFGGSVSIISTATNSVVATVSVGSTPVGVAVTPNGKLAYITLAGQNAVAILDLSTFSVVGTVSVGPAPVRVSIRPDGSQAYVSNQNSNFISVIDTATNAVVNTIVLGRGPYGLKFTPDGTRAYAAISGGNSVTVIDTASLAVVSTINVGLSPTDVAITGDGASVYINNQGSNTISVIDTSTNMVTATIPVGPSPTDVAVSPNQKFVYVSDNASNSESIIDTATNTVTGSISVGSKPVGVIIADVPQVSSATHFVPVTPCRIADTRNLEGPFGGPTLQGQTVRDFAIPSSVCSIPPTAVAYSMNVAVVPSGPLGYLTLWPAGQYQPLVATLNSIDGRVKSNAAIVPAGLNGAVSAFATDKTDVILDINGYFVAGSNPSALAFYPLTPCRIADTRNAAGSLGGPGLAAQSTRSFPIQASPCGVPASAQAYSLNFAAVPTSPTLGFLTAWPAGRSQPLVASLNDPTGTVLANAVVVAAGTSGAVNVYTTNATDLVIDINGYFAPQGPGGLSLYTVTPCRVLDSRLPTGSPPFSTVHDVNVTAVPCGVPATAQAFVFNATVVPPGALGFITMWPQGQSQPLAATLNAYDGAITNNMAIVPTTTGSISVFPVNPTHLVLDIFGFFAP